MTITDKELETLDRWRQEGTPTMRILKGVVPRLMDEGRRLREENAKLRGETTFGHGREIAPIKRFR